MQTTVTVAFTTIGDRENYSRSLPFTNTDRLTADIHMIAKNFIADATIWREGLRVTVKAGIVLINEGHLGKGKYLTSGEK